MKKSNFHSLAALLLFLAACRLNPATNMQSVKNDQVEINYRVTGKGPVTLLFIHGSYLDQTYWQTQVAHFSPYYRVVTMDLAGHGQSGHNRHDWTIANFGQDVIALLDQLDLRQVILVGHSMGAQAALEAAVARPERVVGLVAVEMFKNAATPPPPEMEAQIGTISAALRTDFAQTNEQYARTGLLTPQTGPAIVQRVVDAYRTGYPPMGLPMTEDLFNYYRREKILLPQLRRKLYLLNVDYQPTQEAPLQASAGASYEIVPLHGTCHFPMLEIPEDLNRALEQTFEKIAADR